MAIWYVYPLWHRVSFSLVGQKHVQYLRKYFRVEEIDELAFPHITPHSKPIVFVNPYFYCMLRASRFISRKLHLYGALIGIDVADSDHITNLAVSMTNYATAMVTHSNFCKQAFLRSGVTVPVYVVPHGLDPEWYTKPLSNGVYFNEIAKLKREKKMKIILFFLWHSGFRKGVDLVIEWYKRLKKERKDVIIVLKTWIPNAIEAKQLAPYGCIHIYGWLTEEQKMELFDLADLYPLFSRGGGFEMNGLEALARETVVIAPKGGSWEDYMPSWGLVESKRCPIVLKDNPIHDGGGVEILIEKAVDKAHVILDNLDDYKARVREHVRNHVSKVFRWDVTAEKLRDIALSILNRLRR